MSDASKLPDHIRLAAEQAGLRKALKLFPDGVVSACERGTKPLGNHAALTPTSSPAPVFDPVRFETDQ
jgi:hypothetical protein